MYFDDISIGMSAEIGSKKITKEDMLYFAEKYDPVPIHTDEKFAEKTRFGKLIAPGVMSFMAVWADYVKMDFAGEQLIAGKSTKIEWLLPVFENDELRGKAYITKTVPRNAYNGLVEVTIEIYNQNDELVIKDVTEEIVARNSAVSPQSKI